MFSLRYGSHLVTVESFLQNNFTAELAARPLRGAGEEPAYWLGYQTQNSLQTNMLAAAAGNQISQYYGHWALDQPDIEDGQCVQSVLRGGRQQWELPRCETLLPFMCQIKVSDQALHRIIFICILLIIFRLVLGGASTAVTASV